MHLESAEVHGGDTRKGEHLAEVQSIRADPLIAAGRALVSGA
jgi:hypothetical protein